MLNINNRRIPMEEEFMKDKMISDLLYSMLQSYSNWNKEENHRYIPKKIIKKSKWAKALGISRPTLDKRIGKLLEKEYLIDKEDYYILPNKGEYYFLVPVETLNYLINTANHNVIKIYCHLGLLYKFYGDKAYCISVIEHIRKTVAEAGIPYHGKELHITMTFGVSFCEERELSEKLITLADERMYYGKTHGKNQTVGE